MARCQLCHRDHHYESVCRSKDKPKRRLKTQTDDSDDAIFDSLCTVSSSSNKSKRSIAIGHHQFDNMSETWLSRVSRPQPFVSVKIQASHKDYKALGFSLHTPSKSTSQPAMADTGCQSCLAGIIVLYRLGLTQADLIPVTMQMHAADNKSINILGATLLRVPATDATGWCHRMVICAKKNSKPRRTVDFQPLNMHAKRETHHTPSPFHQARSVPHGKKKTILDAGMGTTACPFGRKTDTSQRS